MLTPSSVRILRDSVRRGDERKTCRRLHQPRQRLPPTRPPSKPSAGVPTPDHRSCVGTGVPHSLASGSRLTTPIIRISGTVDRNLPKAGGNSWVERAGASDIGRNRRYCCILPEARRPKGKSPIVPSLTRNNRGRCNAMERIGLSALLVASLCAPLAAQWIVTDKVIPEARKWRAEPECARASPRRRQTRSYRNLDSGSAEGGNMPAGLGDLSAQPWAQKLFDERKTGREVSRNEMIPRRGQSRVRCARITRCALETSSEGGQSAVCHPPEY